MTRTAAATICVTVGALPLVLSGCSAVTAPSTARSATATTTASAGPATPARTPSAAPTPAAPTWSDDPARDAAYQAEISAWPHPVPPGYAWPGSWSDLPFLGGIVRQQTEYLNAAGIYHCMMVGAAWDAYFTDDDPVAAAHYATLADEFAPTFEASVKVTSEDGTILADALAAESGICRGFVGDLTV